jgi:hypothetical protein
MTPSNGSASSRTETRMVSSDQASRRCSSSPEHADRRARRARLPSLHDKRLATLRVWTSTIGSVRSCPRPRRPTRHRESSFPWFLCAEEHIARVATKFRDQRVDLLNRDRADGDAYVQTDGDETGRRTARGGNPCGAARHHPMKRVRPSPDSTVQEGTGEPRGSQGISRSSREIRPGGWDSMLLRAPCGSTSPRRGTAPLRPAETGRLSRRPRLPGRACLQPGNLDQEVRSGDLEPFELNLGDVPKKLANPVAK